jgi:hypothetical protein
MIVAAMTIAENAVWAQRSYRMAMRLQSFIHGSSPRTWFCEHVFVFMAFFVDGFVIFVLDFTVFADAKTVCGFANLLVRNARSYAFVEKGFTVPIAVISPNCEQSLGLDFQSRQCCKHPLKDTFAAPTYKTFV